MAQTNDRKPGATSSAAEPTPQTTASPGKQTLAPPAAKVGATKPAAPAKPAAPFGAAPAGTPGWANNPAQGAYYRKVESRPGTQFNELDAHATLPMPTFDGKRGNADVPDVYMGASTMNDGSGTSREIDTGLAWSRIDHNGALASTDNASGTDGDHPEHMFTQHPDGQWFDGNGHPVLDKAGKPTKPQHLVPDYAYHPYFRDTSAAQMHWDAKKGKDVSDGGYIDENGHNEGNLKYYYPGEHVDMDLNLNDHGSPHMTIDAIDREHRDQKFDGTYNNPKTKQALTGFSPQANVALKHVVALDQANNEGNPVKPSTATLKGGGFDDATLKGAAGARPMTADRAYAVPMPGRPVATNAIKPGPTNAAGGEHVDIDASKYK